MLTLFLFCFVCCFSVASEQVDGQQRYTTASVKKSHSLAVAGAAAAAIMLTTMSPAFTPSAEAKVVLAKKESKKVFQAEKTKRPAPTFTGKKKTKKAGGGGGGGVKALSSLSAPSVSVPSIGGGGGPLAALPFIFGGSAFFTAVFFVSRLLASCPFSSLSSLSGNVIA